MRSAARPAQGRADPATERSSPTGTCSSPSPTRCSARPPTPRTCSGDLAAVGQCRPRHRAGPPRLPGPDRDPPGADPAAHARPAQGVLCRPLAARATADRARRGGGRGAGRQRLDGDAAGDGVAHADRAGGVRAARGFALDYDEIAEAVDKNPARSARSPTGPGPTSLRAGRGETFLPTRPGAQLAKVQRAIETGDLQGLLDLLAPDVVLLGDGGGLRQDRPAAHRPVPARSLG